MDIKRAKINEFEEIKEFFNKFWGSKPAILNIKEFAQHYFFDGDDLNFILARDNGDIISAHGYVKTSSGLMPDAWGAHLLSRPDINQTAGMQLVNYIHKEMDFRSFCSNNCRKNTLGIYKFLGFFTGRMDHFYRLAKNSSFKIAKIEDKKILPVECSGSKLVLLNTPEQLKSNFDASALKGKNPYKDIEYIIKRYYYFPFYRYLVFGVKTHGSCRTLVVVREEYSQGASILRIVDVIGDYVGFACIGEEIDNLMARFGSEYTDIYCYGLTKEILTMAGFSDRYETKNIIPDHFYPFNQSNIDYYFFTSMSEGFSMFKADGDQDHIYLELL